MILVMTTTINDAVDLLLLSWSRNFLPFVEREDLLAYCANVLRPSTTSVSQLNVGGSLAAVSVTSDSDVHAARRVSNPTNFITFSLESQFDF
jgi:hypothetical protein